MMEVYDRVITSSSMMTLAMLSLMMISSYLLLEIFEWIRHGLMASIGDWLATQFRDRLYEVQMTPNLYSDPHEQIANLNDLNSIKSFLSSNVVLVILDIPYALIILIILVFIHPLIAALGLVFAGLLVLAGWFNDQGNREEMAHANSLGFEGNQFAQSIFRNASSVQAMGMPSPLFTAWQGIQEQMLHKQAKASIHAGLWTACSKWIQTLQSSLLIGLGCLLTLEDLLSPTGSMIIVGSVLGGRLMTPLAPLIPQWRQVIKAQTAWTRISQTIKRLEPDPKPMPLHAPSGLLEVSQVVYQTPPSPSGSVVLLRGIHFKIEAGETLCDLGASGSGKTTLARFLLSKLLFKQ
jgi:ATP-binding cassette subfamily C exporter for protease/lipase